MNKCVNNNLGGLGLSYSSARHSMFDTLVQEGKIQLASAVKTPSVDTAAISQAVVQEVQQGLAQTLSQAVEDSIKAAMPNWIAQL